jgi:hypothetical protein
MDNIKIIQNNLGKIIANAKKQGIVGMAIKNLKQITPTKGVNCPVTIYDSLFEKAAKSLKVKGFQIYD